MSARFSGAQSLGKTTILIVLILASFSALSACATGVTKTYDGPALLKGEICIIAPVIRKADPAEKTKGQKVVSFLLAAPDRYYSLYISKIDGVSAYDGPHPYYELPAGKHSIEFKIQRETTSYWGKTQTEYKNLDFVKTLEMDCKAGHIYFIDFAFDKGSINLISNDVTEDPKYKKIMDKR